MKNFPIYALIIMLASAILTWNAIAVPMTKVHMLENLNQEEARLVEKIINQKGYQLSRQPLFKESRETLVITKTLKNELEPASVQVEVVRQKNAHSVPKTIYNLKIETNNVAEVLENLPTSAELRNSYIDTKELMPMALQN